MAFLPNAVRPEAHQTQSSLFAATQYHPVESFQADPRAKSVQEAFALAGINYNLEDKIVVTPDLSLGIGGIVTIQRALPITIKDGKRQYTARTWAKTVSELVKEKQLNLGEEDRLSLAADAELTADSTLVVTRVARTNVKETEPIKYKTVIEKDYHRFVGDDKVMEKGKNGKLEKTYLLIREDGELVSKTLTSTKILESSVTERIKQGALNPVSAKCAVYKDWVVDASIKNKIDPNALFYRMIRESNCNPNSQASAGYQGLFQYEPNLWPTISAKAGFSGSSVWEAKAQIYTTAWAWANGHRSRWPNP